MAGIPQGSPLGEVLHPAGPVSVGLQRSDSAGTQLSLGKVNTGVQGSALWLAQAPQGHHPRALLGFPVSSGTRAGPGGAWAGQGAGLARVTPALPAPGSAPAAGRGRPRAPLPLAVWRRGRAW